MQISFSYDQFDVLFPYYICTNGEGIIVAAGSAAHTLPGLQAGAGLLRLFSCTTGDGTPLTDIRQLQPQQHVLLRHSSGGDLLEGRFTITADNNQFIFLLSPAVKAQTAVQTLPEIGMEENANLLKMAVEAARAGLWAYDTQTGAFDISEEFKKLVHLLPGQALTLEVMAERVHADDMARLYEYIYPALTMHSPEFLFELRVLVDGHYRHFEAKGNCMRFDHDGTPAKLVGTLRDITGERQKVLELEQQKQFYHRVLDEIPADVVIFTPDHKYLFLNKTAVKDPQLRHWLIGKDDFDYVKYKNLPQDIAISRRKLFNSVMNDKRIHRFIENKGTGKTVQHMLRVFYPVLNDAGEVDLVIGYALDITEQVQNEQYAQLQEKRIKNYMDISSDGIFQSDLSGNLLFYNQSMLRILRHKGRKQPNLFHYVSDEHKEQFMEHLHTLLQTGEKQQGIFTLKQPYGEEERYIEYSITLPVMSETEAFSGRISDVTEVVLKEKILTAAIDREWRLNRSKSQFIHITSHELRTPLTIIQSNAEILKMCMEFPEFQKKKDPIVLIERITKAVSIMTEILTQLLMVSRIENGTIVPEMAEVDVERFIKDEVIEHYTPFNDGRTLQVVFRSAPGTWTFDPKIIRFALMNLLSNAFKYSPHKQPPELQVYIKNKKLHFQVKDHGIGIPKEDIGKLYQSFFRASNVGKISGTGLGLMVVDYAMNSHHGTVTLKTELDKGSTFILSLPTPKL